jgi:serine/threonine protein kinase
MSSEAPEIIAGKYLLERELGHGGYGDVLLVRHADLGVRYALKLISRELSLDEKVIDRFKREAEVLLRFNHPGTVQLRDFGRTAEGRYYIAMDYSEGRPLSEILLEKKALSVKETVHVLLQALNVLQAAHEAGVIHRDVKPENMMIEGDLLGAHSLKVLDFGVAKLREQTLTTTKTVEGSALGTPQYMAPEQAAGDSDIDCRADIYALGVLGYELLTGQVPFLGDTIVQTLLMHITKPPPKFAEVLNVPESLQACIYKALAKMREDRFDSCATFIEALKLVVVPTVEVKAAVAVPQTSVSKSTIEETTKKKILCLDDNEMILNILKHLLEREGFEVFTATTPAAIYPYLFAHKVELLVSDVQMPGLSGSKVCQMLKKTLSDLKIILFSNIPERELEKLSIESKADGFISKNASPVEWMTKIKEIVSVTPAK